MRKNSVKHGRINHAVLRELGNILRNEVKDPRVGELTSVTAADVAADLKTCKVYVSVLGDESVREATKAALDKAEGFIRHALASNLNLRNTPKLTFIMDDSIEYGVAMSEKIDEVIRRDGADGGDDE